MTKQLEALNGKLSQLEYELRQAYINYAKKMDNIAKHEMKPIDDYTDQIIEIKKEIKELERRNEQ